MADKYLNIGPGADIDDSSNTSTSEVWSAEKSYQEVSTVGTSVSRMGI